MAETDMAIQEAVILRKMTLFNCARIYKMTTVLTRYQKTLASAQSDIQMMSFPEKSSSKGDVK